MTIDLKKIQIQADEWQLKNFGPATTNQMMLGVMEELGELAHAELKDQQGIRNNEDHKANQKDAVGDIQIYLIQYCNTKGFDIEEIIKDTWKQVRQRDWIKNKENGHVG